MKIKDLKEEMYIRTIRYFSKLVYIRKIEKIEGKRLILDDYIVDDFEEVYKDKIPFEEVKKASFNIIDLIEIGDYVNGRKVLEIMNDGKMSRVKTEYETYFNEDIETVVTKEILNYVTYYL
jgi:hypothetical protein